MQRRLVVRVSQPAATSFALELPNRAEREVEHLDRVPGTDRLQAPTDRVVVPRLDGDLGIAAVGDLLVGVEDRLFVTGEGGHSQANGHALGEEGSVVGRGEESAASSLG